MSLIVSDRLTVTLMPSLFFVAGRTTAVLASRMMRSSWGTLVVAVMVAACTRASEDAGEQRARPAQRSQQPGPLLSTALATDITTFAPTATDHAGVMIRFDHIRGSTLGAAAEALLSTLPDHRKVVGNTGKKVVNTFDLVLITSSNPSSQTATNMAALMAIAPDRMRTILSNRVSPTRWVSVRGGALGQGTPHSVYYDPRQYLIAMPDWITLAMPVSYGQLTTPRSGGLDVFPARKLLPPWLDRVPSLARVRSSKGQLVALAALNKLPASMALPLVGTLPLPRRAVLALERHRHTDVVSGELHFDTSAAARAFTRTAVTARQMLSIYTPQPGGPQIPALPALRQLLLRQVGVRVQFSVATTRKQTVELTHYATGIIARAMGVPSPVPTAGSPGATRP